MLLLVNRDAKHLATTVVLRLDQGHIKSVWMLSERVCARHSRGPRAYNENAFLPFRLSPCHHREFHEWLQGEVGVLRLAERVL